MGHERTTVSRQATPAGAQPVQGGVAEDAALHVSALTPAAVEALQQSAGNAAVVALLRAQDVAAGQAPAVQPQREERAAPVPAAIATASGGSRLARWPWDQVRKAASGAWSAAKGVAGKAAGWIAANVLAPMTTIANAFIGALPTLVSRITGALRAANPGLIDILAPASLMLRTLSTLRRGVFADAIREERQQRAAASAAGAPRVTDESERGPVERIDGVARSVEDLAVGAAGVQREIVEGAILGDFNDNPNGWNTLGQIAIGFVPYAGQAADVRDFVAGIKRLDEGGWKRPGDWLNLVLVGIGFIPGFGDLVKAGGRAAKGTIAKGARWIVKSAGDLWRGFGRMIPALRRGLGRLASTLRRGIATAFGRVVGKAQAFARGLVTRARGAVARASAFVRGIAGRASSIARGIADRARSAMAAGRGLLGRAAGAVSAGLRGVFGRVSSAVSRGLNAARDGAARARRTVAAATRKVAGFVRDAGRRASDLARAARDRANRMRQAAGRWIAAKAGAIARKVRALRTAGVRKVAGWLRGAADRVRGEVRKLVDRIYRKLPLRVVRWLKSFETTRPSGRPDPAATPSGSPTRIKPGADAEEVRSLTRENEAADILAKAGYKVSHTPEVRVADHVDMGKSPDYRVEGSIFDCYAPKSQTPPRSIWATVKGKVEAGQTRRVVIHLGDWSGDLAALRKQFGAWRIDELDEALVITSSKQIVRLFP